MGMPVDYKSNLKSRNVSQSSSGADTVYVFMDIEIDRGCQAAVCTSIGKEDIQLYKYNEVPEFLQGNPYVRDGYRAFLSSNACIKSLFVWNNETINIWSHLIGFVIFCLCTLVDNIVMIPHYSGGFSDHLIVTAGLLCYQFCMLCSAGYHIFNCHSERASKRWLMTDLAGISVGLIGCYLPAVHYAFYCLSIWRDIYLFTVAILSAAVLFTQLHPRSFSPHWWTKRLILYCCLAAYGIIPTIHWIYLSGGWEEEMVQMFIPKVVIMYFFGMSALGFYLTKFPERYFPGKVDYIGSSHQWWHVIVVAAFFYWHAAGSEIFIYRIQHAPHMCS
ncbi:progestin and adipoQ receptor family member 3 [Lingula anatina]|uniref:Progestin and adipoQ receptor family member 3 n=1 Tax=Lingula anatina TaxID=7574 RepID=A0A1S3HQ25_LINAN|nr:progestin and adipoQ receptor family member 3 [Lingula anatina]|eukprot:XP_013387641.1 progestin and adipoQ receptor family member 3 [Lingula anatina]